MRVSQPRHIHYNIQATNTPERVHFDRKDTFRHVLISGVKTAPNNAPVTDNDNDCWISKVGSANRKFGNKIASNPGGSGDGPVYEYKVPIELPEIPVCDLFVYGTAGDGVLIEFITDVDNDRDNDNTKERKTSEKIDFRTALAQQS